MANLFVNLPALAADGAGAWVDVSAMGGLKTITVEPNGGVFSPFVTIECSNQDTPTIGYPIAAFQQDKDQTVTVACHWMRAVTSNYKGGGAPAVSVGGEDVGTSSAQLPVPVGDGLGTAVDTSALENLKTIQVAGMFGGSVNILVSEDGGASYNNAFSFQGGPGTAFQTAIIVADFMRVERVSVPGVAPGQPLVWVSATSSGGGGGGGGDTLASGRYTATGAEDPNGFPIVFADLDPPITSTNANYNAIVTGGGQASVESFDCPVADYLTTGLTVVSSAALTAGDILIVTIESPGGGVSGGGNIGGSGTPTHLAVFETPTTIGDSPVTIVGTDNTIANTPGLATSPALNPAALAPGPTVLDLDPGAGNAVIRVVPDVNGSYLGTMKAYSGPGEIRVIRNMGGTDDQNSGPLIIMQDVSGGVYETFHLEGRRPNLVVPSLGTIMVQLDDTNKWFVMAMNGVGNINYLRFILPTPLPAGNTDNWAPVDSTTGEPYDFVDWIVAQTDGGGSTLTGLLYVVNAGSGFGRRLLISNFGPGDLTLAHNSGLSDTPNKFFCPGAVDFVVPVFGSVWVTEYNDQLWLVDSTVIGGTGV